MKALILNSGIGSRMGVLTSEHPKCMTDLTFTETILSRQLRQLCEFDIQEVVLTTGYYDQVLINYCRSLNLPVKFTFVKNPIYKETNYIYSIYCAREYLNDDILLMHGDLVFDNEVLEKVLSSSLSCMVVSSSVELPEKDFKARLNNGLITEIGINVFDDAVSAQPLYFLKKADWMIWLNKIEEFCESDVRNVYAEEAFNRIENKFQLFPVDVHNLLCSEIDNQHDLTIVSEELKKLSARTVYMCFSADIIHGAHIAIIKRARRLGKLIIGVLSDSAVASYKRLPLVPASERKLMYENIAGVYRVVEQDTLSYRDNLLKYRPDIVVHGDDWCTGFQRPIRDEVTAILSTYGGRLIEFPYHSEKRYQDIDAHTRANFSMPDFRRGRLRRLLENKGFVTAMEAHDGLTGRIVENTIVYQSGGAHQYDAMWLSSLCDSTAKGKPDIELVDMTSRFRTIEDITEVTTKPIIFDGDTGGRPEHFVYTVRTLERLGVSMVIIEDKTGLKKNSLFGTDVEQVQDDVDSFCEKIRLGKKAQRTTEFMICARIESLILEQGMDDALFRAFSYVDAGADAVMIHSRKKSPAEVFTFIEEFRKKNVYTPIVLVPTSFSSVKEEEWKSRGANIIIYANQLMRASVPAMQKAAKMILECHRAEECDRMLMPFQDIIRLIPEEE